MDSLSTANLSAYASGDPKTAIMQQVRTEAAVGNARQLVEVRYPRRFLGAPVVVHGTK